MGAAILCGIEMPKHSSLLSDCKGTFTNIKGEGLCCDTCEMPLTEVINATIFEIRDVISLIWGKGTEQGVHMDFYGSDPNAMKRWFLLSEKLGLLPELKRT